MLQTIASRSSTRCSRRWITPRSSASMAKTRAMKKPHCTGEAMVSMSGRGPRPAKLGGASDGRPGASGALLLEVGVHQLGHLEHADGILAVEDLLQLGVGLDRPLVLGILEVVLLDVVPDPLGDLGARLRLGADHGGEGVVRLQTLHEP